MSLIAVRCDKPQFKTVRFQPGLNIILAERTKESSVKDSRNGLGKTSLIQVIHFCLGGKPSLVLQSKDLSDWSFSLDLKLRDKPYTITRNTKNKHFVYVEGDCSEWPVKPTVDAGSQVLSINDLNINLGFLMFGLSTSYETKYKPTFRSCISYFVRQNGEHGGFLSPFGNHKSQLEWDKQINNAFLLGLDWVHASEWQVLKDRKKLLSQLKEESEVGVIRDMEGSMGELEAKKVSLEYDIEKQRKELTSFEVHPQYKKIEIESNDLTDQIHQMSNKNIVDRKLLEHYQGSILEEEDVDVKLLNEVYSEVGVVMPKNAIKRIEEIIEFHRQIIQNRKSFLDAEITRVKNSILKNEEQIEKKSHERAKLMNILNSHRALDEYTELQQKNAELVAELGKIKATIDRLRKIEEGQGALKIDLALLQQRARVSLDERAEIKKQAINYFNANSQVLYKSPGILSIDINGSGYKFAVDIEREGSHGINNMKIFCYDLMLAQARHMTDMTPGFLIHDSIIFADVDERQVALSLELAEKETRDKNFQYICTMNSDNVPKNDLGEEFLFDKYVRVKFTDATEDGGLFGLKIKN